MGEACLSKAGKQSTCLPLSARNLLLILFTLTVLPILHSFARWCYLQPERGFTTVE